MTPEQLERTIYDTFIDGYFATPALEQSYRIRARLAAQRIQATMHAERISAERERREAIRTLGRLPLRERIRTLVRDEAAG